MLRRFLPLLAVLLVACQSLPEHGSPAAAAPLRHAVGFEKITIDDVKHARRLPVTLWYPAAGEQPPQRGDLSIYTQLPGRPGLAKRPGRHPLVLVSHGTGGTGLSMAWIAGYLASHGFWVMTVDHPHDSWPNATPEGLLRVWDRPPDLSAMLDRALVDPKIAPYIDATRVAALGHSSGGYTVLALAGARFDRAALAAHCRGANPMGACAMVDAEARERVDFSGAGNEFRDTRVRAVVALAPAVSPGLTAASLASITVPVLLVVSGQDALLGDTPLRLAEHIPDVTLLKLPQAGHFVYISQCNAVGHAEVAMICTDPPDVDRAQLHARLQRRILAFLQTHLGDGGRVE